MSEFESVDILISNIISYIYKDVSVMRIFSVWTFAWLNNNQAFFQAFMFSIIFFTTKNHGFCHLHWDPYSVSNSVTLCSFPFSLPFNTN